MHRVARKIRDKRVLRLIGKYLRAGAKVRGRLQKTRDGGFRKAARFRRFWLTSFWMPGQRA